MFEWRKKVQILRAENALRDGRLDEAFAIASDPQLRDWRACQVILEKLVDPLLDRAALHLAGGRAGEALADVERAHTAGGNRPRVAELRAQACARLEERRRENTRERDLLASARRHLAHGSVGAGKALLEGVATMDPEAARLKREAERRELTAREACDRSELLLAEGALLEAVRAAREAVAACARHEGLPPLFLKLKGAALPAITRAIEEGSLALAQELHSSLLAVCGESLETRRFGESLSLCREVSLLMESERYDDARSSLSRLRGLLPGATWLEGCERALGGVAEGLRALRAGPLASLSSGKRETGPEAFTSTMAAPAGAPRFSPGEGASRSGSYLLWVDGVGSYLVLSSDRVTIGRAGSSARPDLALSADIGGIHAEVLRVDEDYFLASHGAVQVNGRSVDRKLLESGDRISLGPRCEMQFRTPTALSTSAVLSLNGCQRIAGDVREVILLHHHLLLGAAEGCHVRAAGATSQAVISGGPGGLVLRAEEGITMDGRPVGQEAVLEPGAQVKVNDLTFTVTPLSGERC